MAVTTKNEVGVGFLNYVVYLQLQIHLLIEEVLVPFVSVLALISAKLWIIDLATSKCR